MIVWLHIRVFPGVERASFLALGVSLFFVLSGFILAHNYRGLDRANIPRFLVARISKIFPLHWLSLALFLLLLPSPDFPPADTSDVIKLITNILLLQAWYPNVSTTFAFNGVSWTLSNELFFYLFFPLIYVTFAGRILAVFAVWAAFFIVSTCIVTWLQPPLPWSLNWQKVYHFLPIYRLGEFLAGVLAYELFYRHLHGKTTNWFLVSTLQVLAVITSIYISSFATHMAQPLLKTQYGPIAYWFLLTSGILPAVVLVLTLSMRGAVSWVLGAQPFRLLGEISFATYMLHQIVLRLFRESGLPVMFDIGLLLLIYLTIVYSISYYAWRFVEVPAQTFIRTWHSKGLSTARTRVSSLLGLGGRKDWLGVIAATILVIALSRILTKDVRFPVTEPLYARLENGLELNLSPVKECYSGLCLNATWNHPDACDLRMLRFVQILDEKNRPVRTLSLKLGSQLCDHESYKDAIRIPGHMLIARASIRLGVFDQGKQSMLVFTEGTKGRWIWLWRRAEMYP